MAENIDSIIQWHKQTFPDATLEGQEQKWEDEREEWENTSSGTPDELFELADMIIVCCGVMRFDYAKGFNYLAATMDKLCVTPIDGEELWRAVENKMQINRNRKWAKQNGAYQHVENTES